MGSQFLWCSRLSWASGLSLQTIWFRFTFAAAVLLTQSTHLTHSQSSPCLIITGRHSPTISVHQTIVRVQTEMARDGLSVHLCSSKHTHTMCATSLSLLITHTTPLSLCLYPRCSFVSSHSGLGLLLSSSAPSSNRALSVTSPSHGRTCRNSKRSRWVHILYLSCVRPVDITNQCHLNRLSHLALALYRNHALLTRQILLSVCCVGSFE